MSLRVRCTRCRAAFLTADDQPGQTVECPKCGARHRLPEAAEARATTVERSGRRPSPPSRPRRSSFPPRKPGPLRPAAVGCWRSGPARWRSSLAGVAALDLWPRVKPRARLDPVERVAEGYLQALIKGDLAAQQRLSTIEEPPAIRSYQGVHRDSSHNRTIKGSFAPLAPSTSGSSPNSPTIRRSPGSRRSTRWVRPPRRSTPCTRPRRRPRNRGSTRRWPAAIPTTSSTPPRTSARSSPSSPKGLLAPKKILPTYKMLVDEAKPPIPRAEKELALAVADDPKTWDCAPEAALSHAQSPTARSSSSKPG